FPTHPSMPKSEFGVKIYGRFTEALLSCCELRTKTRPAPWEAGAANWMQNETVTGH
ncbi:hypothetical protein HAX54_040767, partial [Datura stramonium]|nr:hypothetical protein [Datura stramonium]